MKRLAIAAVLMTATALIFALPPFVKVAESTYKYGESTPAAKAKCTLCHATMKGGKLNAYGADLKKALTEKSTKKLTAEILHSIDKLDSNKDGVKNGEALKAGKLP